MCHEDDSDLERGVIGDGPIHEAGVTIPAPVGRRMPSKMELWMEMITIKGDLEDYSKVNGHFPSPYFFGFITKSLNRPSSFLLTYRVSMVGRKSGLAASSQHVDCQWS